MIVATAGRATALDGRYSTLGKRRKYDDEFYLNWHDQAEKYRCVMPGCGKLLRPFDTGRFMFCSDECRDRWHAERRARFDHMPAKRGKR